MLACLECKREFLHAATKTKSYDLNNGVFESLETRVCPYCQSPDLREVELAQPAIESMKQVAYDEVDGFLKEGYEVKEAYATKVTMVKKTRETKQ